MSFNAKFNAGYMKQCTDLVYSEEKCAVESIDIHIFQFMRAQRIIDKIKILISR